VAKFRSLLGLSCDGRISVGGGKKNSLVCPASQSTGVAQLSHGDAGSVCGQGRGSRVFSVCVRGLLPMRKVAGAICPSAGRVFFIEG
jgi:hypothetical protein